MLLRVHSPIFTTVMLGAEGLWLFFLIFILVEDNSVQRGNRKEMRSGNLREDSTRWLPSFSQL